MSHTDNLYQQKVVKFAQELLSDEDDKSKITPSIISDKIDLVLALNPKWKEGFVKEAAIDELIRRFSEWVGKTSIMKNDAGHVDWLNSSRKSGWRYWQRYQEWLERKLSYSAIDDLNHVTDQVLSLLEDPKREGAWDRRGLVVGHVQSGKTGNYTGLICKAADAGYKIIIVLAGLHNNLRSQTQMRLDEGFLGYETKPSPTDIQIIGVGEIDSDISIRPNYVTNRSEKGDFSAAIAKNLGISPEQRPWLFVVKKNKSVLEKLVKWIANHVANSRDDKTGRKIVDHLPLLVIDDEADNASVDTKEQVFDGNNMPDPDHEPTAINRLIRQLLHTFNKSAYVGYTATPFANIFIHEQSETTTEGPDLFPSAFIINLAAPSTYIGPARVFGSDGKRAGLPLIRPIDDFTDKNSVSGWMPTGHKNGHIPLTNGIDDIPQSLKDAIHAFYLATACRSLRGQENQHSSMLIHVTRFTNVQNDVYRQVESYVAGSKQRLLRSIDSEGLLNSLKALWESDFVPTSNIVSNVDPELMVATVPTWSEIQGVLSDVVSDIKVSMINGKAKDALDYEENKRKGLKVIAIGGDKLARGLTLEGLTVSYFLRASKMYDTLMQMGRWFGYRPGYVDLCRLYITDELAEWFGHISLAAEELREEFDLMVESGATPKEYGLKVQSHPTLMVTSRLKMRYAKDLMLSFSGQLLETILFYKDKVTLERNVRALQELLEGVSDPEIDPKRLRPDIKQAWNGYLWSSVSAEKVIDFLLAYRTHDDAYKVNGRMLAEFITSMNLKGELTNWSVVLIGGGEGDRFEPIQGIGVDMLKRKQKGFKTDRYTIGRLMSSRDESIDLNNAEWEAALRLTVNSWKPDQGRLHQQTPPTEPNGPSIRRIRGFGAPESGIVGHPERGLLTLYALDPARAETTFEDEKMPIIGFGISFPSSNSGLKIKYKVTNRLWEDEYGPSE